MNTTYTYPEKPTLVNVIGWMILASGIINILWGLGASAIAILTIVGICCTPFTILPSILGIFEIIYAAKLLSNPPQPVRPSTALAVLQIACILIGNVFAMVVGILSLIFYNDQVVKDYFARLNGNLPPEPVPPVAPLVPPVVPASPAPVEEPIPSPITGEAPVGGEAPAPEQESPTPASEPPASSASESEEPTSAEEPPSVPDQPDSSQKPQEE